MTILGSAPSSRQFGAAGSQCTQAHGHHAPHAGGSESCTMPAPRPHHEDQRGEEPRPPTPRSGHDGVWERGEEGERGTRAGLVVLPLGARSEARRSRPCRGACLVHEEASPTWRGEERPTCRAPHESLRGVSPAGLRLWKGQERA
ncbi:unnamed protein product [Prorocentrum cordatum]|uniref:Uncharacterized protein n=1 Tax=Prorocentrum cordatum TaxID=2364126 RepID=A0ABN9V5A1_9DINO|nr:unnamed protein product [Polarella glacialis]